MACAQHFQPTLKNYLLYKGCYLLYKSWYKCLWPPCKGVEQQASKLVHTCMCLLDDCVDQTMSTAPLTAVSIIKVTNTCAVIQHLKTRGISPQSHS